MPGCVKLVMLSCRVPTFLLYVGAVPHDSVSDHYSFFSSQFLTKLQPKETLLDPFLNVETVVLNLVSTLLRALLFVTKNSISLSKNAPRNGFCIDCGMVLLFFWLWLHYGTLQTCCFLPSSCIVSCYFEKREGRKEWDD